MKIFYINGSARSGKDTFVDSVAYRVSTLKLSTIDRVKEIAAEHLGWDGEKDEKGRALLSAIKNTWTDYNDGPIMEMREIIGRSQHCAAIFIMVREFPEMMKMQKLMGGKTINVVRPGIEVGPTEQEFLDMVPEDYEYDFVIDNSGNLGQLEYQAKSFARFDVLLS